MNRFKLLEACFAFPDYYSWELAGRTAWNDCPRFTCLQLIWPTLIVKKWLNIKPNVDEFSQDESDNESYLEDDGKLYFLGYLEIVTIIQIYLLHFKKIWGKYLVLHAG
jgi:hypothetical protein